MGVDHRTFDERRAILKTMIRGDEREIANLDLNDSEDNFYRSRANRALDKATKNTSNFKAYYSLPTAKPFLSVVIPSVIIVISASAFAILIYAASDDPSKAAPIFAACLTITVIALGWVFVGWNSHNNTVRQNTNNLLFARFAHTPFSEAIHRFHLIFGSDQRVLISWESFQKLRSSKSDEERKAAESLIYLLNYYEFIASGVVRGDLDKRVVRDNIRGNIEFYHDKCSLIIRAARKTNPRTFEYLSKIRAHYRET